ncbi:MAG TPA: redoxin domain-containing protein [Nitrospirae bacterium]|nr:redoxin domain-containing protein [Nitrospirota bacterium]
MLDFETYAEEYKKNDIPVIAISSDTKEHARSFSDELKLSYIVGYGLNAKETSEITGCYYHEERGYLHATGFVIGPLGRVMRSLYCKETKDRLKAEDCLKLIQSLR